jgi:L-Ala-D/L-Glu epimerase
MTAISRIDLQRLDIPLREPFVISLETIEHARNILVRIETADGITGFGECSPYRTIAGETQDSAYEVGKLLAQALKGLDALNIEGCIAAMDRTIAGNRCIKSAFDMALYDIAARRAGLPLYAFLGGANDRELYTDMTVSLGEPAKMAADAEKFLAAGFKAIKVKVGGRTEEDVERIRAIREAVGYGTPLTIDANQAWNVVTAVRTLRALDVYRIDYCEAPVHAADLYGLAEVKARSPIPVMADESLFDHRDAVRHVRMDACDYFNIKLAKSGGIHNALKIAAIAEAAGIPCQIGCFSESRIASSAFAHFALARRIVRHYDLDSPLMLAEDPVKGGVRYEKGGRIVVGEEVGIGGSLL